jgi:hypothetical protein
VQPHLHHVSSVAASAGVVDYFAPERPPPIVTGSAALKGAAAMLPQLRHRYLNGVVVAENVVTLGALDPLALRMNLVGESETVGPAHCGRRFLVASERVAFAAT